MIIYKGKVKHIKAYFELLTDRFQSWKIGDLIKFMEEHKNGNN